MDEVRAIENGFKLPFSSLIMGLVINEDKAPLTKGVWVDVGVIMGLRSGLSRFDHLERNAKILINLFKHK